MNKKYIKNKISLAPMVDRTDKNFRHFLRMLSPNITLYTEMITDKAIINASDNVLDNNLNNSSPIVVQLATNNVKEAVLATKILNKYPYDEININVGCPSDRISDNKMGAYLMSEPDLVCDIVKNMKEVTDKPISIKHRIGIDGTGILKEPKKYMGYDNLCEFITKLNNVGIEKYIVHARIAILKGLSPKQNRIIPELDYEMVYKLKEDFSDLFIEINGGVKNLEDIQKHLKKVDAVMIGRKLYEDPMFSLEIEKNIYNNHVENTREEIVRKILEHTKYMDSQQMHRYLMHTMGLYLNSFGSSKWKQICSTTKVQKEEILRFLEEVEKC